MAKYRTNYSTRRYCVSDARYVRGGAAVVEGSAYARDTGHVVWYALVAGPSEVRDNVVDDLGDDLGDPRSHASVDRVYSSLLIRAVPGGRTLLARESWPNV